MATRFLPAPVRAVPRVPGLVRAGDGPDDRDAGLGLPALHQYARRQPARLPQARGLLPGRGAGDIGKVVQLRTHLPRHALRPQHVEEPGTERAERRDRPGVEEAISSPRLS